MVFFCVQFYLQHLATWDEAVLMILFRLFEELFRMFFKIVVVFLLFFFFVVLFI